jgi:hypothetical protein
MQVQEPNESEDVKIRQVCKKEKRRENRRDEPHEMTKASLVFDTPEGPIKHPSRPVPAPEGSLTQRTAPGGAGGPTGTFIEKERSGAILRDNSHFLTQPVELEALQESDDETATPTATLDHSQSDIPKQSDQFGGNGGHVQPALELSTSGTGLESPGKVHQAMSPLLRHRPESVPPLSEPHFMTPIRPPQPRARQVRRVKRAGTPKREVFRLAPFTGLVLDPEAVFGGCNLGNRELVPILDYIQKNVEQAPLGKHLVTNPRFSRAKSTRTDGGDQLAAAVSARFPQVTARRSISPSRRETTQVTRFRGGSRTPRRKPFEEAAALRCLSTTRPVSCRIERAPGD